MAATYERMQSIMKNMERKNEILDREVGNSLRKVAELHYELQQYAMVISYYHAGGDDVMTTS